VGQLGVEGGRRGEPGLAELREVAAAQLSPVGQLQVTTALDMLAALDEQLHALRLRLHHPPGT
jgi:hypothetical protein